MENYNSVLEMSGGWVHYSLREEYGPPIFHRTDGPAIFNKLTGFKAYYLFNKKINVNSDKELKKYIKMNSFT